MSPRDVYDAILFHDVIYDPRGSDNEVRSAALARTLGGSSERAAHLIELTARHRALAAAELDGDLDAAHFLDADLAILGARDEVYDCYEDGIAFEYRHVPPEAYRAGRRSFLEWLAAAPQLYFTLLFNARLDGAARRNLSRAIARLARD